MGKTMHCPDNEEMSLLMSSKLDGELAAGDERLLQQHLAGCPICQAEWAAMQQVSALFDGVEMVGPPLGFAVRVDRRLATKARKQKQTFGGLAVLTSSLSLAGVTIGAVVLIALGVLVWIWLGPQGATAVSQVASGVGLLGKGATLFLKDVLLRYGLPLVLLVGVGLLFLVGMWAWLFVHRPGNSHHNGYV
jgi:anti-sigma factor RsiW